MDIRAGVLLADWCTMGVGGPARWFVQARTEADVVAALEWADERRLPVLVLGGGSNVIIADAGFPGLVLQIDIRGVDVRGDDVHATFRAGSGEPWDPFVAHTIENHCAGLECLSGIPGLVGGTPVQNVGAYGQDVSGTISGVRVIDRTARAALDMTPAECLFGYRTSRFRHADAGRFIVTRVDFALTPNGAPTLAYADVVNYFADRPQPTLGEVRHAIIEIRARKGMVIREGNPANKSCGSFFVNPVITRTNFARMGDAPHYPAGADRVKVPAAWLIEHAGFPKGHVQGCVGISPFQAQGLINIGGAAASDVVGLAIAIKRAVWSRFAVALVPEPVFVGFEDDAAVRWLLDPAPSAPSVAEGEP